MSDTTPVKGSTATLAEWISNGAKSSVNVVIMRAKDIQDITAINKADGYVLGSGVYNGNPEPEMINFIDNVLLAGQADKSKRPNIENKPFGTFCTSGGTGIKCYG